MIKYSTELKTKLVLEVIKEESTLVEIASKNNSNHSAPSQTRHIIFSNQSISHLI